MTSRLIYHERQRDQLCGVHALNALLQGPYFSAPDLSAIGLELDATERSLLGGSTRPNASENVDESGNFSIQVLSKALDVFGLTLSSLAHPNEGAAREDANREMAFVCNLERHWFALRKIPGSGGWWDLNSLAVAPKRIGEFYLSAFLRQLEVDGYSIFIVRDLTSTTLPDMAGQTSENGRWFSEEEAMAATSDSAQAQKHGRARLAAERAMSRAAQGGVLSNGGDGDGEDAELQAALRASMGDFAAANGGVMPGNEDADLNAAIAASLGVDAERGRDDAEGRAEPSLAAAIAASLETSGLDDDMMEDPELAAAIAASLNESKTSTGNADEARTGDASSARTSAGKRSFEEADAVDVSLATPTSTRLPPDEPPADTEGCLSLAFRLPDGSRLGPRRFLPSHTVGDLESFLSVSSTWMDARRHVLASQYPPSTLDDASVSLALAGVRDKDILVVRTRTSGHQS